MPDQRSIPEFYMAQAAIAPRFPMSSKQSVAKKTTLVSVVLNLVLMALQISVGTFAHSQALIADGVHSLGDLVSDFIVLLANLHSHAEPDQDHNYGHSRYETVASLFLGAVLVTVGAGMLVRAGMRLTELSTLPAVHISAFGIALVVLLSKELLFRYMLREARRVRSASVCGVRLLDPIAAAVVGFMVARMGWTFGWDAVQDLSDRALDENAADNIYALLVATSGVRGVHELRTRKMGDLALVDAHILVDPLISVSEGHYIAESARLKVLEAPSVLDALIHVDPENDLFGKPTPGLPSREQLTAEITRAFASSNIHVLDVNIHYLRRGIDLEITLPESSAMPATTTLQQLRKKLDVRQIRVARELAVVPERA
jgi:divalent metal cation (Fe/Co/Zn/Cd) transporter